MQTCETNTDDLAFEVIMSLNGLKYFYDSTISAALASYLHKKGLRVTPEQRQEILDKVNAALNNLK